MKKPGLFQNYGQLIGWFVFGLVSILLMYEFLESFR
jgi:hypothetical protein